MLVHGRLGVSGEYIARSTRRRQPAASGFDKYIRGPMRGAGDLRHDRHMTRTVTDPFASLASSSTALPSLQGPIVELTEVRKEYPETVALAGVTLTVHAGEAVAVMGRSGSGKSTLLNMVAGLDRPTSGEIRVRGDDLNAMGERDLALFRRRHIGMIFQFFNLLDDLTALDNVALAAQLTGTAPGPARDRALELLAELGIAERASVYPARLSGGERQRVAVARALMNRPALLLADEPTGALDSRSGEQVVDLLLDLNQIGQTLILVTHDEDLARQCATRLIEVADGSIVRDESVGRA